MEGIVPELPIGPPNARAVRGSRPATWGGLPSRDRSPSLAGWHSRRDPQLRRGFVNQLENRCITLAVLGNKPAERERAVRRTCDSVRGMSDLRTVYRACNLCEAICGLEIKVDGPKIVSIRGDDARSVQPRTHLSEGRGAAGHPRGSESAAPADAGSVDGAMASRSRGTRRSSWPRRSSPRFSVAARQRRRRLLHRQSVGPQHRHAAATSSPLARVLKTKQRVQRDVRRSTAAAARVAADVRASVPDPDPRHRPHRLLPDPRRAIRSHRTAA